MRQQVWVGSDLLRLPTIPASHEKGLGSGGKKGDDVHGLSVARRGPRTRPLCWFRIGPACITRN